MRVVSLYVSLSLFPFQLNDSRTYESEIFFRVAAKQENVASSDLGEMIIIRLNGHSQSTNNPTNQQDQKLSSLFLSLQLISQEYHSEERIHTHTHTKDSEECRSH